MKLHEEHCRPPAGGPSRLEEAERAALALETPRWTPAGEAIEREFAFRDFREAIGFVNRVAELAEREDHHPDIIVNYSRVRLTLTTHKTGGLTRCDFILAARIDRLL